MYKKNLLSGILLQIWKIVFKLVFSVLVARVVGKVTYGQITYFFLVFNLLGTYGHLGIVNGISYFAKKDSCDLKKQFDSNISYLAINCFIIGLVLLIPPVQNLVLPNTSQLYVIAGMLFVLLTYIYSALDAYFVSQEKIFKSNLCMGIGMLVSIIGMLVCFFCHKINMTTYIVFQIAEVLVAVILMYRDNTFSYKPRLDASFLIREFKYGNIVFWASLFGYLNYRIDQFMIKGQLGDGLLGIYSVAVTIAELVLLIPNSITASLTGKMLNLNEEKEQKNVLCLTMKGCFYICLGLTVLGMVCAPLIEVIYGKEYHEAITSFRILLVGICGAALGKVVYPYYLAKGQAKIHMFVTALIMLVNVGLNLVLIPVYGINGAAFASTCSYFVYGGIYVIFLLKKEGIKLKAMFVWTHMEIQEIKRSIRRENRVL